MRIRIKLLGRGHRTTDSQPGMIDEIVDYLRRSGWVTQSVDAVLADLPRWERRLRSRGVSAIPRLGSRSFWSPAASRAHNEINLLMRQASRDRDASIEHELRNLTGTRPYKS
jgi:hypothetical protein